MSNTADFIKADSLFNGRLHCFQSKDGYRFSIDPVLLSHFIPFQPNSSILDLGAGCGIISLIVAYRFPSVHITTLELQSTLFSLLQKNIESNGLEDRISALQRDLRDIKKYVPTGSFDYVLCNPPYRKCGAARKSKGTEQAIARHELFASLNDFINASFFVLKTGGSLGVVYPAERGATLINTLKNGGLEPKRLQVVYSYPGSSGKFVLVEAMKGGGERLEIMQPFYVHMGSGDDYTPEMAALYAAEPAMKKNSSRV